MAMAGLVAVPTVSSSLCIAAFTTASSCRPAPSSSAVKVGSSGSTFNGKIKIQVAPAARVEQWRSLEVSAMAKREQQLVDIRQMTDVDIGITVVDLKGELFVLRCKQATRQEYSSSDFRKIRKQIARMLTVRREREIVNGISVRESRKLDREWKKNAVIRPPPSLASINKRQTSS